MRNSSETPQAGPGPSTQPARPQQSAHGERSSGGNRDWPPQEAYHSQPGSKCVHYGYLRVPENGCTPWHSRGASLDLNAVFGACIGADSDPAVHAGGSKHADSLCFSVRTPLNPLLCSAGHGCGWWQDVHGCFKNNHPGALRTCPCCQAFLTVTDSASCSWLLCVCFS